MEEFHPRGTRAIPHPIGRSTLPRAHQSPTTSDKKVISFPKKGAGSGS
jgi:hypothetical protein